MKTLKSLKITSIIQAIPCFFCLTTIAFLFLSSGRDIGILAWAAFLSLYAIVNLSLVIPPACFIIKLLCFLVERRDPEQRKLIGKKWIWIFAWLIVGIACLVISALPIRPHAPSAPTP